MTRRTRKLQFFASTEEIGPILEACWSAGLFVYAVEDDRTRRLDVPVVGDAVLGRVLVGADDVVPDHAHRQPARYGLVVLDLPRCVDDELQMADLGAVNVWTINGEGFKDDRALEVFGAVEKALRDRLIGSVYVESRSSGAGQHYPAIRATAAAVADWRKGMCWSQNGVAGLVYRPYDDDRDT